MSGFYTVEGIAPATAREGILYGGATAEDIAPKTHRLYAYAFALTEGNG